MEWYDIDNDITILIFYEVVINIKSCYFKVNITLTNSYARYLDIYNSKHSCHGTQYLQNGYRS